MTPSILSQAPTTGAELIYCTKQHNNLHKLKPALSFMMVSAYGYFYANYLPVINKEV